MPDQLFVVGLNWRTAPVSVREKLAFHDEEIEGALASLLSDGLISEAIILSTCNRVEIYGCTSRSSPASAVNQAAAECRSFISDSRGYPAEKVSEVLYEHLEGDAIRHIFNVSSALDSMVVGESQILGQLKAAYGEASRHQAIGPVLGRCLERAFGVAKRVRTETGISRGAANVSSVAVELAKRVFGALEGKDILIVGAGKMSALAARHLRADGGGILNVTNRSLDKAERLATEIDGVARPWEDLEGQLAQADVIITSTGAREPIIDKKLMKRVMKARKYRSMVMIDIAVPRDVEARVGKLDGVYLFDIDDLEQMVKENLKGRQREADSAHTLIEAEVATFSNWVRQQHAVPTIRALRQRFHDVAEEEVTKSLRLIEGASSAAEREEAVRRLGKVIANKLLHAPMNALKSEHQVEQLVVAADRLFTLFNEEESAESDTVGLGEAVDTRTKKA